MATVLDNGGTWDVHSSAMADTTNWEAFELPLWVRSVVLKNAGSTGTLLLGRPGQTGAFAGTEKYATIAAGGSLSINIGGGQSQPATGRRTLSLYSATASQRVEIVMLAAA